MKKNTWSNKIENHTEESARQPKETLLDLVKENLFLKRLVLSAVSLALVALLAVIYAFILRTPLVLAVSSSGFVQTLPHKTRTTEEIGHLARRAVVDLYEYNPLSERQVLETPYATDALLQKIKHHPPATGAFRKFLHQDTQVKLNEQGSIGAVFEGINLEGRIDEPTVGQTRMRIHLRFIERSRDRDNPYGLELIDIDEELIETH